MLSTYPLRTGSCRDDGLLHPSPLQDVADNQQDIEKARHEQDEDHVERPVDESRKRVPQVARASTDEAGHVVLLLAWIDDDQSDVEHRCVEGEETDGCVVQKETMALDEMIVIDEEVPFDRCPGSENDAQNEQRVIDQDPHGTESLVRQRAAVEKGQSER